jgi:hypothetical protein
MVKHRPLQDGEAPSAALSPKAAQGVEATKLILKKINSEQLFHF